MGELKQVYLLIQSDIVENKIKEALDTYNIHYNKIKHIKGFQNFTVSVISTLAQKLQSELASTNQKTQPEISTNHVIQFANHCFKGIILTELEPLHNSLYVIVRYLLFKNHVSEAIQFSNYLLKDSSPPGDTLKHIVQLFAHFIHKNCPIDDHLKKINVTSMWNAALNLVKRFTGKEIEYVLCSLTMLIKNINGTTLHEGHSMDLVILDMTLESVLTSTVFRNKCDRESMLNIYFMLIEIIAAVMQNMMRRQQMNVHCLIKHIKLMVDVCCLNKSENEALSFLILFLKFIDSSVKDGIELNSELRKMIIFVQKFEPTSVLPNTIIYHVFKATINIITKLKNLWYEKLVINSSETASQVFVFVQHLVYLSKHNPISKMCCKSDDCNLIEDSTSEMSLINVVFIMIRHLINKPNTFLRSEDILPWMELFISLLECVSKSNCSNKISFIEFSLTSAYNLCVHLSSGELTHLFLDFLEKLCLLLDPTSIDSDLVARVAVLLSRYLYNSNKNNEAIRCIAYWCVRTRSELAAQQWVHLKCKEEKNNCAVKQTILNMFEDDIELNKKWPTYSLKILDDVEIMWLELKAHNYQNKVKQDTTTVLELFEKLMGHKLSREKKCQVIITTAYIILHSNSINGLKTVTDVLEDYIQKLEVEASMEQKSRPLVLGNLYYSHFMCLLKHLQNLVCKELDSYTEERFERGMEQQNTTQYEPMSWILPSKIKPKLFHSLNCAVTNWSALINDTIKDEYDVKILFRSLQEVAFIFKLHCDPKEVEVWQLLYKLASNKKCHKHTFIALTELLKIGHICLPELDNSTKHLPAMAIDYKLALATSHLNQSKFNDAQILLENINDRELNNNVLIMAEYSFLKSRLCFESGKFNKNNCLYIFIEAFNLAHGLIKRLDSFYEYLVMHFIILSICSYLNLICLNTFRPVEARYFLKVQMNIVLKSVLTKRALNVFAMNCWNELLCCNFENVNKLFEHVVTLLDFKEDKFDLDVQKITVNHSSNIMSTPLSDYRCKPNTTKNKTSSPSLKRFNNKSTQMSLTEFCTDTITNKKIHDPIIIYSVIETCILKAVYCSNINQLIVAEHFFKMAFKLMKLSSPQFNKNEIYNILTARQKSLANYHYAKHLVISNKELESVDYIQKAKESCHDEWLSLGVKELSISLKMNSTMSYPQMLPPKMHHSPVLETRKYELKTPAITKVRVNAKTSKQIPRIVVTPAVRKLKMTLESPKTKENKIQSPLIKETEKIKKSTVKKKYGKENIVNSANQDLEIKIREKRSTRKNTSTEQPPLSIKNRSKRLNL